MSDYLSCVCLGKNYELIMVLALSSVLSGMVGSI